MKTNLLLSKGFIAALTIAICTVTSFSQNEGAKNDLKRSFRKFDLQKIVEIPEAARNRILHLKADGKEMRLRVEPHDLRSTRYRSEDSSSPGDRLPASAQVNTFKGIVDGEQISSVRVSINEKKIEGYFLSNGKKFFIESAAKYTNLAAPGESVVYNEEDSLIESTLLCESDIPAQIEGGKEIVSAQAATLGLASQDIELATDADQEYVSNLGGPAAANNEILSILNMTEGVYQTELNLSITVVYQHTWSTQDGYDGTSMSTILDSFLTYWNANIPVSNVPRDATHLFTGKTAAASAGLAYVGVICRAPQYAYGLSGYISWAPGKYLIPTHEIGHNLGANHVDATQSCTSTVMNAQLAATTTLTFCTYSRNEIGTYVAANGSCLSGAPGGTPTPTPAPTATPTPVATPTPPPPSGATPSRFDFDGDARADISLFRPGNGTWYLSRSSSGFTAFQFGQNGDRAVPADYDGDGKTDVAVYRGGVWYRMKSSTNSYDVVSFGLPTDIATPADFDGDGKVDAAVYRPITGTWWLLNSGLGSATSLQFGLNGDIPLPGDYDGDGRADINVFRPSNGTWYRINSSTNLFAALQFGISGDKGISGDFDGDRKVDIAVWRPANGVWYVLRSSDGTYFGSAFGLYEDIPAAADYDGDRRTDLAVFRPSTGVWYRMNSSNGTISIDRFGLAGDVPSAGFYVQ